MSVKTVKCVKKPTEKLSVFKIDYGEQCWYVAASERKALNLFAADQSYPKLTFAQFRKTIPDFNVIVSRLLDEEELTINVEEDGDGPLTQTAAEWTKSGPGCIASSDF